MRPRSGSENNPNFQCPLPGCPYQATNIVELYRHIEQFHLGSTEYKCEKCDFVTDSRLKFIRHSRFHQFNGQFINPRKHERRIDYIIDGIKEEPEKEEETPLAIENDPKTAKIFREIEEAEDALLLEFGEMENMTGNDSQKNEYDTQVRWE